MLCENIARVSGRLVWPDGTEERITVDLATKRDEHKWAGRAYLLERDRPSRGKTPKFASDPGQQPVVVQRLDGGEFYSNEWFLKLEHR